MQPWETPLDGPLGDQIVYVERMPPRDGIYQNPNAPMHPLLRQSLEDRGMGRLFSHQAQAYDAAMDGKDVAVVTGTSSGKTLCYNLPALQFALTEPAARMLYMFPTKALAQDQLGKLEQLIPDRRARVGTYDGDTPPNQRSAIRKHAHIVLTNPDMLHIGILPGHELWTKFLKSLRLIVLDEMHVYRGVFGSHVGNVVRRLLRLCAWHHNRPQIIGCSATIGNPAELFEKLTGRKPELIDGDGAPRAERTYVFFNPPEIGENERLSTNVATSEILATLIEHDYRALSFSGARVSAELVLRYTRERLKRAGEAKPDAVESYRAGYTAKERRTIEQDLFQGRLKGMSATSAMELGVDVGGLDAVVLNGYPGTVGSFLQQAGRAGRGTTPGLVVYVARNDALEQFLLRNPDRLLAGASESAALNPENPAVLAQQLRCAAHERALAPSELAAFGDSALAVAESLDREGTLAFRDGRFFYPSHEPPAPSVNIRGGGDEITLLLENEVLGTMERWRAYRSAHEGAVYLHRGQTFLVTELDLDLRLARLQAFGGSFYTQAMVQSLVETRVDLASVDLGRSKATLCGLRVTSMVVGFKRKSLDGETVLDVVPLEFPPETMDTVGVRFDLEPPIPGDGEGLDEEAVLEGQTGGVHGAEHALATIAPLFAGCDRGDLGTAWYAVYPDTLKPAVFVYDGTPGGVGLAERLFERLGDWIAASERLVAGCECGGGCPACLLSARCEAGNEALDKRETVRLLKSLTVRAG